MIPIEICPSFLGKPEKWLPFLKGLSSRFAVITDENVQALYGDRLAKVLLGAGLEAYVFSFPAGEASKTRRTKEALEDKMFEAGLGRDTCLIALGGGIVTDLGGYIAATYCRGIPLILVPTSFLGMVDASIGGKTGVDVPYGKNLVGVIYQPQKIYIDPEMLKSLPLQELRNGAVEMIKHALIQDKELFAYFEKEREAILAQVPDVLEKAISQSCLIKKEIVEEDEKENGKRRLLNLGHTVAHAIETLSKYSLPHGEAVAIGIVTEARMAVEMKLLSQKTFERIYQIFLNYGLPFKLPSSYSLEQIQAAMFLDKKALKGRPRFVMLDEIGSPVSYDSQWCTFVDDKLLTNALQWMLHDLCRH